MKNSIMINTDSYKVSMYKQYPPKTEYVYSYIESRGGQYDSTVFFGLQAFIREYLLKPITGQMIDEAYEFWTASGIEFSKENWYYILDEHGGYLPLSITAAKEGLVISTKNVLATVVNTDPKCYWLTTWVETALLRAVWYPTTVATRSYNIKKIIKKYLTLNGDDAVDFKLHDFGARGVSSYESAALGGMAHLINFSGTDTSLGTLAANEYYNAGIVGFSIPAAEHSTITSWGRDHEEDAFRNMIKQFAKPGSIVAVVSDSYDIYNAASELWGTKLKQEVIDSGATIVIRPDSGDPENVIIKLLGILENKFGVTRNSKEYKVLNNVRLIQGDGVDEKVIERILSHMHIIGFSADNIAFGMGGQLLQQLDRDTQKFAMKCSAIKIDGKWIDVVKDPITDPGKKSKAGLVTLYKRKNGSYYSGAQDWDSSELETVFLNGKLIRDMSFEEVRNNSNE